MWGTPLQWKKFIEFFRERNIKAEAIDYKKSIRDTFSDYVNEVAKKARGEILVGHSMGGLIVQKVATMVKIKAGIAIGSAPPKGIRFNAPVTLHSIRYIPSILMKRGFKPSYKFARNYLLNCIEEERAKEIYSSFEPESPFAAYDVFKGVKVDENMVKSPLFFIAGKKDRVAPVKMQRKIADRYKSRVEIINACHWIFDDPYEAGNKIIEFLGEL